MIYNTRNQSNDTTESRKEKNICFNAQTWLSNVYSNIVSKEIRCGH